MKTSKDIAAMFDITPGQQKSLANGIDIIYSEGADMMRKRAIKAYCSCCEFRKKECSNNNYACIGKTEFMTKLDQQ